jgi:pimeloyl-ACP methyl ester carboxylesterase
MRNQCLRPYLAVTVGLAVALAVAVDAAQGAVIIFKDGFYIVGTVRQKSDFLVDPGGASFRIPAGFYYVDDSVRRIVFSPSQVQEVLKDDPKGKTDLMELKRPGPTEAGIDFSASWKVEEIGEWDKKWNRRLIISMGGRKFPLIQHVTRLTPKTVRIDALKYNWIPHYFTPELGSEQVRLLLKKYYEDKKQLKKSEQRLNIMRFLYQTGWLDEAAKELEEFEKEFPKDEAKSFREQLRSRGASLVAERILQAHKVGQHKKVAEDLEQFKQLANLVDDKIRLQVAELEQNAATARENLKQVRNYLKTLPSLVVGQPLFKDAAAQIAAEVNVDTLSRLETFREYARQYENETKQKRPHTQNAEQVLALAVTGWLQGNAVAEPEVKSAHNLWRARQIVLECQKTDDPATRKQLADSLMKELNMPVDVLGRLIHHLPPPEPPEKINGEPMLLNTPDGQTYIVQLPPEYHPHRAYPVLMLLHAAADDPRQMLLRFSDIAKRQGYILAAPVLGKGIKIYEYSGKEQAVVVGTLRDLRRKFQVDSDRVFLFGWREGATIAWDVGLAYPDQFAGILPVNGDPRLFPSRCWCNAQYLPIYAVGGDVDGNGSKWHKSIFKDFIRSHYPALFVEYKGRGIEWYQAEVPLMFDWMNRKTRAYPIRQLGLAHTGGGKAEEFKTYRTDSNQFYWLSSDRILPRCLATMDEMKRNVAIFPASLQGRITTGNELGVKAGGAVGKAKVWYQIDVRAYGVEQVTLWLGPKMIDFTKPILLRVNGTRIGQMQVVTPSLHDLLEDFYRRGDRQRLFYKRIDRKI